LSWGFRSSEEPVEDERWFATRIGGDMCFFSSAASETFSFCDDEGEESVSSVVGGFDAAFDTAGNVVGELVDTDIGTGDIAMGVACVAGGDARMGIVKIGDEDISGKLR